MPNPCPKHARNSTADIVTVNLQMDSHRGPIKHPVPSRASKILYNSLDLQSNIIQRTPSASKRSEYPINPVKNDVKVKEGIILKPSKPQKSNKLIVNLMRNKEHPKMLRSSSGSLNSPILTQQKPKKLPQVRSSCEQQLTDRYKHHQKPFEKGASLQIHTIAKTYNKPAKLISSMKSGSVVIGSFSKDVKEPFSKSKEKTLLSNSAIPLGIFPVLENSQISRGSRSETARQQVTRIRQDNSQVNTAPMRRLQTRSVQKEKEELAQFLSNFEKESKQLQAQKQPLLEMSSSVSRFIPATNHPSNYMPTKQPTFSIPNNFANEQLSSKNRTLEPKIKGEPNAPSLPYPPQYFPPNSYPFYPVSMHPYHHPMRMIPPPPGYYPSPAAPSQPHQMGPTMHLNHFQRPFPPYYPNFNPPRQLLQPKGPISSSPQHNNQKQAKDEQPKHPQGSTIKDETNNKMDNFSFLNDYTSAYDRTMMPFQVIQMPQGLQGRRRRKIQTYNGPEQSNSATKPGNRVSNGNHSNNEFNNGAQSRRSHLKRLSSHSNKTKQALKMTDEKWLLLKGSYRSNIQRQSHTNQGDFTARNRSQTRSWRNIGNKSQDISRESYLYQGTTDMTSDSKDSLQNNFGLSANKSTSARILQLKETFLQRIKQFGLSSFSSKSPRKNLLVGKVSNKQLLQEKHRKMIEEIRKQQSLSKCSEQVSHKLPSVFEETISKLINQSEHLLKKSNINSSTVRLSLRYASKQLSKSLNPPIAPSLSAKSLQNTEKQSNNSAVEESKNISTIHTLPYKQWANPIIARDLSEFQKHSHELRQVWVQIRKENPCSISSWTDQSANESSENTQVIMEDENESVESSERPQRPQRQLVVASRKDLSYQKQVSSVNFSNKTIRTTTKLLIDLRQSDKIADFSCPPQ